MAPFSEEYISDAELLAEAKKSLYDRSRLLAPEATLAVVQDLKRWADQELAFEEGASASFGRLMSDLWHAEYLDQLPPLFNRFDRLVSAYFVRRGSVTAFHGFCKAWRTRVLQRVLQFAEEGLDLDDLGHAPAPYALLASGGLGRGEPTLDEGERYFLVWRGDDAAYFEPFAYRVIAIMDQYGMLGKEGPAVIGKLLWRGSLDQWRGFTEEGVQASEQPGTLEVLADLSFVCGDRALGRDALRQTRAALVEGRCGKTFVDFIRCVVDSPVALGLLGGIRVEKSGDHAGCCNPVQSGLLPLVGAVRLLALQYGLEPGPTLERLGELASQGVLSGALQQRLEGAYQVLAGVKVRREIALEDPYLDPAKLPEAEREKLKEAFESVRQLQRFIRCAFLGRDLTKSLIPGALQPSTITGV